MMPFMSKTMAQAGAGFADFITVVTMPCIGGGFQQRGISLAF
jgi:hypothetical protein